MATNPYATPTVAYTGMSNLNQNQQNQNQATISPAPAPNQNQNQYSSDGLVTYNQNGQRLDSLGNVAYGGGGGSSNTGPTRDDVQGWSGWSANQPSYPAAGGWRDDDPNRPQTSGEYNTPAQYAPTGQQQAGQVGAPEWRMPGTFGEYTGAPADQLARYQEWMQMYLPYNQAQQNAYQYGQDFGESARRWDLEYGSNQANQAWQQQFAEQQQQFYESQQGIANQQWNQQFLAEQGLANRGMTLQEQQAAQAAYEFGQNYGLANRGMTLQEQQSLRDYGIATGRLDLDRLTAEQRYGLDSRAQALAEQSSARDYTLAQSQQQMQAAELARRYGLDERQVSAQIYAQQQQQVLAQNQQAQDRWRYEQQFGLDYSQLNQQQQQFMAEQDLARWRYGQEFGLQDRSLAQNQSQFAADQAQNRWRYEQEFGLQSQSLAQQLQIEQLRLAEQARQANIGATGRALAPNTRWLRAT